MIHLVRVSSPEPGEEHTGPRARPWKSASDGGTATSPRLVSPREGFSANQTAPRLKRLGDIASRTGSLRPEDPVRRRALHICIGVLLVLGVAAIAVPALGGFPDLDHPFQPAWCALGVFGFVAVALLSAEVWRRLLQALGPTIDPVRATSIWCTSALGRYVPTSLLLPIIRAAMCERLRVPKRICLASVVYEFALAFAGALVLGAYFVVNMPQLSDDPARFLAVGLPLIGLITLQPAIFRRAANALLHALGRQPLPLVLPGSRILAFVGLYAGIYAVAGLSVYALAASVYPVNSGDIVTVTGAFAVGTTLSFIAFVLPGGLIAREAGLAVALSSVMAAGPAVACAILARIAQMSTELALAALTRAPRSVEQANSEVPGSRTPKPPSP